MPGGPALVSFAHYGGVPLISILKVGGHGHAEVGIVDKAVGEHEVDGDDGRQYVDLADENEGHCHQARQKDSRHRGLVWAFLSGRKGHTILAIPVTMYQMHVLCASNSTQFV